MSLKQCPGCQEMVDESKAYCPDCGTPMDEEQRRTGASEYDSLMKTQNINVTSHLKMMEQMNLSSIFTPPKTDEPETAKKEPFAVKRETKTVQLQPITENNSSVKQPINTVPKPKTENNLSSNNNAVAGDVPSSKKTLYIIGGVVLLLIALAVAAAVTFGILYWYNK